MKTFQHSGRIGDAIYGLLVVRALGGGRVLLKPDPRFGFTEKNAMDLIPLLEAQPYITSAAIFNGEAIEIDLDAFRAGSRWKESLADAHLAPFSLPLSEKETAWLMVDEPIHAAPVVFARSLERHGAPGFWEKTTSMLRHCAVFVGTEQEHEHFENRFGRVEYRPTQNLLELAQVIAGAELFVGNQSAAYAIAEGLKKMAIQESYPVEPNCRFDRRDCLPVVDERGVHDIPAFILTHVHQGLVLPTPEEQAALDLVPAQSRSVAFAHDDPGRGARLLSPKLPRARILDYWESSGEADVIVAFGEQQAALLSPQLDEIRRAKRQLISMVGSPLLSGHLFRAKTGQRFYSLAEPVPTPEAPKGERPMEVGGRGLLGEASLRGASIIVLTYNSAKTIGLCLSSVLDSLSPDDELIVVDNGSEDDTPELVRQILSLSPEANARLILNERNLGFSAGCNIGIRASAGEVIILLNPDTRVWQGWTGALRRRLAEPMVGAVGPVTDYVSGRQFVSCHLAPDDRVLTHQQLWRRVRQLHAGESEETKLLVGFCLALRRATLERIGLFDEDLFLGGEDLEMSLRLRLHGYKLMIARDVFVHHAGRKSFASLEGEQGNELLQESTAVLHQKIEELYTPYPVPSSTDLFGIDILPARLCGKEIHNVA